MAEDSGQDKTEDPTGKRISQSRKKGQVARSRELNTFISLMSGSVLLIMMGGRVGQGLMNIMKGEFQLTRAMIFDTNTIISHFYQTITQGIMLIAPILAVSVVTAIASPILIGGWNFSLESMQPKFSKLDPIKGIPKLFGVRGLIELLKSAVKICLIFAVVLLVMKLYIKPLIGLTGEPIKQAIIHGLDMLSRSFLILSVSLILVAAFDVPYQLWTHKKQLKMTKQEVKDESKESETSPEVKNKIRQAQMQMANQRMMEEVPKADVIVTNPTHYAVALRYNQLQGGAPKLVAKGVDLVAAHIRNLAVGASVPIVASPPLARALYFSTEIDNEIPQGLYLSVAQVLAYVYQLKAAFDMGSPEPTPPSNIEIPAEYRRD
ncbi:MAG: flagellar biosynthesis protein FlhB [Methylococcaceae bacterium]